MFYKTTPEQVGIKSADLYKQINKLIDGGYNFHSIFMAKGDKVFYESYFAPFTAEMPHRMYSQTKSFMAVALGVLYDRGLVNLDAPFYTYFPEYEKYIKDENFKNQTVRNMLTMTGTATPDNWFKAHPEDRLVFYFSSPCPRLAGAWFDYDSTGSFALGALVEKLCKKSLLQFMQEILPEEMGFDNAKMLVCPGGNSWADSGLLCTTRAMAEIGRLFNNYGSYNGRQIVSKEYMTDAMTIHSSKIFANNKSRYYGYGYQIWMSSEEVFSFHGMGGQFTIFVPSKDFVFSCTGDNQGPEGTILAEKLFDEITEIAYSSGDEIPENKDDFEMLETFSKSCKIKTAHKGKNADMSMQEKINHKKFICNNNPMGWKWFQLDFGEISTLKYENEQGIKELKFSYDSNIIQPFPQLGYSNNTGSVYTDTRLFECAVSGGWDYGNKMNIFVQIIDEYLAKLNMNFVFPDENNCGFIFEKTAEDFLWEYDGEGIARAE